jgi:hypothetical protein
MNPNGSYSPIPPFPYSLSPVPLPRRFRSLELQFLLRPEDGTPGCVILDRFAALHADADARLGLGFSAEQVLQKRHGASGKWV